MARKILLVAELPDFDTPDAYEQIERMVAAIPGATIDTYDVADFTGEFWLFGGDRIDQF